ncbi:hypothetical protein ACFE04_005582 [Oxalis oulophora]
MSTQIITRISQSRKIKTPYSKTGIGYSIYSRTYAKSATKRGKRNNLFSRISPLGDPQANLVPVLDKWVEQGKSVNQAEVRHIIRDLRSHKRFNHALQVSEWISGKGLYPMSAGEHAVQLDLIGKVRGSEYAETYFNNLSDEDKINKTYGALLNCYVREGLVDKSLSTLQKIKEMGLSSNALNYNDLMCLYTNTGQLEKISDVILEMKDNGVAPDNISYRICLNSYMTRSDVKGMEKVLEEMQSQSHITMDWPTYSLVANLYIKEGMKHEALIYLKKCEEIVGKDAIGYNHLISHYASLGNKGEILRLWGVQKEKCKRQINRDYITALGSLVKIGEFEESEKLVKKWESCCKTYDFRVPNTLLIGYVKKGLVEKAEAMLHGVIEKGQIPTPNSWSIVAAGYKGKDNMEMAFECFKNALIVQSENKGWRPKPELVSSILKWLADNGNLEEVEAFVILLKRKMLETREMYHALVKTYLRSGKDTTKLLEDIESDGIYREEIDKMIVGYNNSNNSVKVE